MRSEEEFISLAGILENPREVASTLASIRIGFLSSIFLVERERARIRDALPRRTRARSYEIPAKRVTFAWEVHSMHFSRARDHCFTHTNASECIVNARKLVEAPPRSEFSSHKRTRHKDGQTEGGGRYTGGIYHDNNAEFVQELLAQFRPSGKNERRSVCLQVGEEVALDANGIYFIFDEETLIRDYQPRNCL